MRCHALAAALLSLFSLCFQTVPAAALSVKAVSVEDLLARSALIVEGRVIQSNARKVKGTRFIQTCALVEISDVIKGAPAADQVELCFLGGQLGQTSMQVPGMLYPALGETGIYFVEAPGQPMIHPLYGAAQGHFRIQPGPAGKRMLVRTADGRAVAQVAGSSGRPAAGLSDGVARGIGIAAKSQEGLSPADFKAALRHILAGTPQ